MRILIRAASVFAALAHHHTCGHSPGTPEERLTRVEETALRIEAFILSAGGAK